MAGRLPDAENEVDDGDPARDDAFLSWLTRSIRAMSYYWRGLTPPDEP